MTDRAEIERLLNQTGRTLEGLPESYEPEEAMKASKRGKEHGWTQGEVILHQSDTIEFLLDALRDALDKQPKWISAKERLPEKGDDVLISLCGCNVKQAEYRGDGIFEAAYADTYHATGMGSIVLTHWMPMPEPAKEV